VLSPKLFIRYLCATMLLVVCSANSSSLRGYQPAFGPFIAIPVDSTTAVCIDSESEFLELNITTIVREQSSSSLSEDAYVYASYDRGYVWLLGLKRGLAKFHLVEGTFIEEDVVPLPFNENIREIMAFDVEGEELVVEYSDRIVVFPKMESKTSIVLEKGEYFEFLQDKNASLYSNGEWNLTSRMAPRFIDEKHLVVAIGSALFRLAFLNGDIRMLVREAGSSDVVYNINPLCVYADEHNIVYSARSNGVTKVCHLMIDEEFATRSEHLYIGDNKIVGLGISADKERLLAVMYDSSRVRSRRYSIIELAK